MTSCQARRNVLEFGWVITTLKQIIEKGAKIVLCILGPIIFSKKGVNIYYLSHWTGSYLLKIEYGWIFQFKLSFIHHNFVLNSLHVRGHFIYYTIIPNFTSKNDHGGISKTLICGVGLCTYIVHIINDTLSQKFHPYLFNFKLVTEGWMKKL